MKIISAAVTAVGLFVLSLLMLVSCPNPIDESLLDSVKDEITPEIELFTPKDGSYCAKTVEVTGKVKDKASEAGENGKIEKVQFEIPSSSISGDADLEENGNFSFQFSTVTLGSNFVLKVSAEDWNGNTGEVTLNLALMDGSDIPSFTAVAGNKKVKLTWDEVPNTSSYTLYYTTEGSTPSQDYGLSVSDVTSPYTLSGLENGAMHVFKLRAHSEDSGGDDSWSGLNQAIPLSSFTLAPEVIPGEGKLTITWPEIPATDQFEVWRSSEKDTGYINKSGLRTGNEYVDTAVDGSEGFYYKIRPSLSGAALSEYAFGVPDPFPTQMGISDGYNTDGSCSFNVAVSGNYAYVADGDKGLRIFNITDPNDISLVETVATTLAMDVAVNDDYIFLADQAGGLRIYDIDTAQLRHTVELGAWNAWGVAVSENYAYLACSSGGGGSLKIVDITDPDPANFDIEDEESIGASAVAVDVAGNFAYVAADTAGMEIINITVIDDGNPAESYTVDTVQNAYDVAVSGDYAYVVGSANLSNPTGGLKVINISTPATASVDHSIDTPGIAHGVAVFGSSVFVADEQVGLQIIQAEDPETAFLYDTIAMPPFYDVRGVTVIDGYAYMAGSNGSFYVLNVKNPFSNPQIVNTLTTSDNASKIAVSGDYLYLTDDDGGLRVYRVTDPDAPVLLKTITDPGGYADLEVKGDYLFASVGTGIVAIDIENPASAALIGGLTTNGLSKGLEVHGDFAYVACGNAGLKIIDITNPVSPLLVDTIYTAGSAYGVAVSDGYVYVTDSVSGVQIVDITDPYSADVVENVSITGTAQGITVSGDYAYVTVDGSDPNRYCLQIIDISNPRAPSVISEVTTPDDNFDVGWSCSISGKYAYLAYHTGGVIIIDVADAANPVVIKQIDASTEFSSRTIGTAVTGKYLYSADGGDGLRVIDLLPSQ